MLAFRVQGLGFRVKGLGFRVLGFRFRVSTLNIRDPTSAFIRRLLIASKRHTSHVTLHLIASQASARASHMSIAEGGRPLVKAGQQQQQHALRITLHPSNA